ncbi:MAG: ABC transporter permease subunit [Clostridia bacterium]|nr:ABC transporter permease subunit [Clostridia bacterium]
MTLFVHEMRRGRRALLIWAAAIGALTLMCILLFPEMKSQMSGMADLFAGMGAFTAAFGMDKISIADALGFYGIEGGNILGLGGAMFAALLGAGALASEEVGHTAEFLLTHPVRRSRIAAEKLLAVLAQVLLLNLLVSALALLGFLGIGEAPSHSDFLRLHAGWLCMQLETATLAFGLSPFLRGGSMGAGLGLALGLYFMNLVANIGARAEFLRWITPFAYCEASDVLASAQLNGARLALGLLYALAAACAGLQRFARKDICG